MRVLYGETEQCGPERFRGICSDRADIKPNFWTTKIGDLTSDASHLILDHTSILYATIKTYMYLLARVDITIYNSDHRSHATSGCNHSPLLSLLLYQVRVGVLAEQPKPLLSFCVHPRARAKVLPLVLGVSWSRSFE